MMNEMIFRKNVIQLWNRLTAEKTNNLMPFPLVRNLWHRQREGRISFKTLDQIIAKRLNHF